MISLEKGFASNYLQDFENKDENVDHSFDTSSSSSESGIDEDGSDLSKKKAIIQKQRR